MEKDEDGSSGPPAWLSGSSRAGGPGSSASSRRSSREVKSELKKVTWPSKQEVYNTTIVVILTTVFFGFYLYGLDLVMSQVFTRILRQ